MKVATKIYQKNAFIYLEGKNNSNNFYIVKSGKIKINRKNPILGETEEIKGSGYIFGIIQCITGISDDEVAQAITDCELFVIPKNSINTLYVEHPNVILKILSEYAEILRKLDKELVVFDFYINFYNRIEKIIEVAKKYIELNQKEKAAHLLKTSLIEFKDNQTAIEKINLLINELPDVDIITTSQTLTEMHIAPNTVIFTEFENGDNFYVIKKGKVKITKLQHDKETLLATLREGDIFGEMSILNDKPRNATAQSETDIDIMVINKNSISKLPATLFLKILEFLTKRIWFVQQQLICFKLPIPTAKLYYLLCSKIKLEIPEPKKEYDKSFLFKVPVDEFYQMLDFTDKMKNEVSDFLNDKNIEISWDSVRIKNIGDLFDKNVYNFSRALFAYNGTIEKGR
ncbi:MAG TPA: cyclic nucleotide-binding domain-containing protein [Spirochaetota bacterium]|nr:cyclic nucleotide-binding domain-containing protein [Spirochaetota bacterium]